MEIKLSLENRHKQAEIIFRNLGSLTTELKTLFKAAKLDEKEQFIVISRSLLGAAIGYFLAKAKDGHEKQVGEIITKQFEEILIEMIEISIANNKDTENANSCH